MKSALMTKLDPSRLAGLSPAVASMLGIVLRADFTSPCFDRFEISNTGLVFMHTEDGSELPVFVGDLAQVQMSLTMAASLAGLSTPEFRQFEALCTHSLGTCLYH